MNIRQQIALAFRNRPLLAPMLLAAVCVDVACAFAQTAARRPGELWLFFLLGQTALLAFWTAAWNRFWYCKLAASLLIGLGFALSLGIRWDSVGPVLAAYYGLILVLDILGRLASLLWRKPQADAPRFSVWQVLVVMTVVAVLVAGGRGLDWSQVVIEKGASNVVLATINTITVFGCLAAIPFATRWLLSNMRSRLLALPLSMVVSCGLGLLLASSTNIVPVTLSDAVLPFLALWFPCAVWFLAMAVEPDAVRRLAARRERRAAKLTIVQPPGETREESERTEQPPERIDLDG